MNIYWRQLTHYKGLSKLTYSSEDTAVVKFLFQFKKMRFDRLTFLTVQYKENKFEDRMSHLLGNMKVFKFETLICLEEFIQLVEFYNYFDNISWYIPLEINDTEMEYWRGKCVEANNNLSKYNHGSFF
jgi:hypothetical protein